MRRSKLEHQLVSMISNIVCARCRLSGERTPEECKNFGCVKLYKQEAKVIVQYLIDTNLLQNVGD